MENLRAEELRIGNLLKQKDDSRDCNGCCSVLTLDKDGLRTDFTIIKHGIKVTTISYYQFNSELINECIKPIPLTEYWLLRFKEIQKIDEGLFSIDGERYIELTFKGDGYNVDVGVIS